MTFSYTSSDESITNYSYTVSKIVNSRVVVLCSDSSSLLSEDFECDLFGHSGTIYIQGVADNDAIFYGEYLIIPGLPTLFDNLDPAEASYLAAFIMAIIVFGGLVFGLGATLIFTVAGLYIINLLGLLTVVTGTMVLVAAVVSIVVILGFKRR